MRRTLALLVTLSLGVAGCSAGDPSSEQAGAANHVPAVGSEQHGDGAADATYLDRLDATLREQLDGTGARVAPEGEGLRVAIPGNIAFYSNSADLRSDYFDVLNSIAKTLSEFDRTSIRVTAHTDATGSETINQPLSQRRADSVATYLRSQKIASTRIASFGYGSRYPIASNDSPAGREQNRRVELDLVLDK